MSDSTWSLPPPLLADGGKRLSFAAYAFLTLLCLAFFTPGLSTLPPTDRDESLFAQASKQMIESGNYVDIRVQQEHRYKKPIGIYWLQAISTRILGEHQINQIWTYRVPSTIGCIIAVLMTAATGSLLFTPGVGFLAAVMMACCLIVNVEARQAKTDAALLASIMVAQYCLARAYFGTIKSFVVPSAFWVAVGIGILLKGPIILLVVCSTLLWIYLTEKDVGFFKSLRPLAGMTIAAFITLPWLAAIGIASHGAFFQQSAGHDMLGKVGKGEFRGMIPPGAYIVAMPFTFFPSSLLVMLAAPDAWAARKERTVRFCLGWIIPAWIVFELTLTKLPHYVMPLYPAMALLAAKAMIDGFPTLAERRFRWVPPLAVAVWLVVGMALALGASLGSRIVDGMWSPWGVAGGLALISFQGVALYFLMMRKPRVVATFAAGMLIFLTCVFGMTLPYMHRIWVSRQVTEFANAMKPCEKLQLVSASYDEPSLIFMAGTDTKFVPSGNIAAMELWHDPCMLALIDQTHNSAFLEAFPAKTYQPEAIGSIEGFNFGSGRTAKLTLYSLPRPTKP